VGAIKCSPFQAHPVKRSLDYAVLFGVDGTANLVASTGRDVLLISQAAQFKAVLYPGSGSVVSGGKDVLIPNGHGANVVTQTG